MMFYPNDVLIIIRKNVPCGTALAGLVLGHSTNLGLLQPKNNSDCDQSVDTSFIN